MERVCHGRTGAQSEQGEREASKAVHFGIRNLYSLRKVISCEASCLSRKDRKHTLDSLLETLKALGYAFSLLGERAVACADDGYFIGRLGVELEKLHKLRQGVRDDAGLKLQIKKKDHACLELHIKKNPLHRHQ